MLKRRFAGLIVFVAMISALFLLTSCGGDTCEHTYERTALTDPTCVSEGYEELTCSQCGVSTKYTIPALGHDTKVIEAKDATCTEAGYKEYEICTRCIRSYFLRIGPCPCKRKNDRPGIFRAEYHCWC